MLTSDTMNISMSEIICPSSEKLETPINLQEPKEPRFFSSRVNSNSTIEIEHVHFPPQIVPLFLIILLPLICLKSPTFFTKFNSLGTANIFFLIGVVFYFATKWGINANFGDINADDYIPMFKNTFPSLSGMMALGLFIHNAILTIVKKNRCQENNVR